MYINNIKGYSKYVYTFPSLTKSADNVYINLEKFFLIVLFLRNCT